MFKLSQSVNLQIQSLSEKEFEKRLLRFSRSNLLQSLIYAKIEEKRVNIKILSYLFRFIHGQSQAYLLEY